jgi:gliding motility-associated-like protein
MRKQDRFYLTLKSLVFILLLAVSSLSFAQSDEYYVKLSDRSSQSALMGHPLVKEVHCPFRHRDMQRTFLVKLKKEVSQQELLNSISGYISFEYVEVLPEVKLFFTPNDLQGNQYALSIINAQQAWDLNLNASNARIAIIDDAIDITHPDLAGTIWTNPDEIPGDGIDNDFNGFSDDVNGWDFADHDNNPNPPSAALSHGTHVSGIASASTDNATGIAAIGMNAKIVPIKIGLDATGALTGGPQAIDYAISLGVDVINMSWGGSVYSQIYQDLFDIAYNEGIVCVAAAGNASTNLPMYPASYNHVISVASTNASDQVSSFSNFGPTVDLAAPGSSIYSTLPGSPAYGNMSGTSMAAPCVAGLVALMRDANPLATVDEIEACLTSTCDPITGPLSTQVGAGRINAYQAMLCITEPTAEFTSDVTQVCPGNSIQFFNFSAWPGTTYSWSFPGGVPSTSSLQNPVVSYPNGGTFDVTLTVTNGPINQTITMPAYVTITEPTAVISGVSSIVAGGYGSISVNFTGQPPYSINIFDGTNNYPVTGIINSPYVQYFNPTVDTDYTLTSFSDSQCTGIPSGIGTINVNTAAVTTCDSVNVSFTKYLGTNIEDISSGVTDLGQHGYLVLGRKQFSSTNIRMYICRLDKCGTVLWENIYDQNMYGLPIAAHIDGNEIFICGYHGTSNTSPQTLMMRLDLNGNVLDARRISGNNATHYPRYMVKAANGDYILGSVTNASGFSLGANDNYVVRTLPNGTIQWQTRLGSSNNEFLHNLHEDNAGNILTTGYLIEGGLRSGYIMKLSSTGTLLWSRKYNMGSGHTYFTEVLELNGFYYAVGRTEVATYGGSDGLIVKLDLVGNIIWSKKIGGTGYDLLAGIDTYSDTLFVLARSSTGATSQEVVLTKFDQNGNLLSYGSFGTPVNDLQTLSGRTVRTTSNGNWIGVSSGNAGVLGGYDITLFKINTYADLCQPSTVTIQGSDIALQSQNFVISTTTPTWNFNPVTISVTPVISNQGYACSNITPPCSITSDFDATPVFCLNDSVQLTDLTSSTGSYVNHWDFGDGTSSGFVSSGNYTHLYSSPGTYNIELIAVDTAFGCSDTITKSVTISTNPIIDLPDTLFACLYDTLQIDLTETCLSSQAIVTWSPDSIIVSYQGNDITIEVQYFGYVTVTVEDNGIILTDSVYIAESINCCTTIPVIDPPLTSCFNEPITFTESSTTNGSTNYEWSFLPDGNPVNWTGQTPPDVTFPTTGTKLIVLAVTDDCGISYDTLDISIVEPPLFDLGPDVYSCSDTTLHLGDTLIDNWTYLWQPGTVVSDSISSDPTATIVSDEMITVAVTDPWTGCTTYDTLNVFIDSLALDLGPDLFFCSDTSIQLGIAIEPNIEYNWTPTSIVSDPLIADPVVSVSGNHAVTLTIMDTLSSCSVTDTIELSIDLVEIDLGPDLIFCDDTTIVLGPAANPDYDYSWSPSSVVSDPTIANPSTLISGNDTISVQVTSTTSGCSNSDTAIYSIDPVFVTILSNDTVLCTPSTITIDANHSGFNDILWQPSSSVVQQNFNSVDMSFNGNTVVYATTFNATGSCSDTDSIIVTFDSPPLAIVIDSVICEDETFLYSPTGAWFDGFQVVGQISLSQEGVYTYTEDHACGTTIHEIALDVVSCDCNVYVPNAFTPDGQQLNNVFAVVTDCYFHQYELTIYNRWGERIFQSFDENVGWDGTYNGQNVQDGVYTWKLTYLDDIQQVPVQLVGHVSVIR